MFTNFCCSVCSRSPMAFNIISFQCNPASFPSLDETDTVVDTSDPTEDSNNRRVQYKFTITTDSLYLKLARDQKFKIFVRDTEKFKIEGSREGEKFKIEGFKMEKSSR